MPNSSGAARYQVGCHGRDGNAVNENSRVQSYVTAVIGMHDIVRLLGNQLPLIQAISKRRK